MLYYPVAVLKMNKNGEISAKRLQNAFEDKEDSDGAYQDIEYQESAEYRKEGRMRRVPDILSVCMQDFLYRWKSELRAEVIRLRL